MNRAPEILPYASPTKSARRGGGRRQEVFVAVYVIVGITVVLGDIVLSWLGRNAPDLGAMFAREAFPYKAPGVLALVILLVGLLVRRYSSATATAKSRHSAANV